MASANVFKRFEIKYMLTRQQKLELMKAMEGHMKLDGYGRTVIRNIYYDTPDHMLIRTSIEKPVYKEKLRLRAYTNTNREDNIYVELKKKYEGIVYKRRIVMPEGMATDWLGGDIKRPFNSQIAREIDYTKNFYKDLRPACFLSYEREAYEATDGEDIRLTLDENIKGRDYDLSLTKGIYGTDITGSDQTLMEIKVPGAIPMWMIRFLSDNNIRKTSFSKYGTYYKQQMQRGDLGGRIYA